MWWKEILFALRALRRRPGIVLGIILCLALGIGATSAVFTVFHAALLKPLPFAEPERLTMLYDMQLSPDGTPQEYRVSPRNFDAWRRQNEVFAELTAIGELEVNLSGDGEPVYLRAAAVMANWASTFGLQPVLGRTFSADEDQVGNPAPVTVLSHGFWQRQFGGDPGIVGRSLVLDGESVTVIGVMPPGFAFPDGIDGFEPRDLWLPFGLDPERLPERNWHNLFVLGRLAPGVALEQAQTHMDGIAARLTEEYPDTNTGWGVLVTPLRRALVGGDVGSALAMLMTGVGFLLLIACVNVASLLLAHAAGRGSEMALRVALGSGRGRLLRLALTESVLLALLGGAAGLALAWLALPPLLALSGLAGPAFSDVGIDVSVLGFALAVTLVTGVLFGLAPALKLLGTDLREVLTEGTTRAGRGRWGRWVQGALVAGQIALVLVLLVGAGLLVRSFRQLLAVEPGFDAAGLLTVRLPFSANVYPEQSDKAALTERILGEVRSLPGVESATVTFVLPLGDLEAAAIFTVQGRVPAEPNEMLLTNNRMVGSDFFSALEIPIVEGRPLDARDEAPGAPGTLVVSRRMAELYWPGRSALGRQVKRGGPNAETPWLTVVGVAEDVRDTALDAAYGSTWYLPYGQHVTPWLRLVARTSADPMSLAPAVRQAIWSVDPDQAITDVTTVEAMITGSVAEERFSMVLLTSFAGVGLILAVLGVYGSMSYWVQQRRTEIGIRMALGARARRVRAMVLGEGVALTGSGLALGVVLSLLVSRLFESLLFGVEPTDPWTIAAMAFFLAAVALVAAYLPARRATRVDPATVLKAL